MENVEAIQTRFMREGLWLLTRRYSMMMVGCLTVVAISFGLQWFIADREQKRFADQQATIAVLLKIEDRQERQHVATTTLALMQVGKAQERRTKVPVARPGVFEIVEQTAITGAVGNPTPAKKVNWPKQFRRAAVYTFAIGWALPSLLIALTLRRASRSWVRDLKVNRWLLCIAVAPALLLCLESLRHHKSDVRVVDVNDIVDRLLERYGFPRGNETAVVLQRWSAVFSALRVIRAGDARFDTARITSQLKEVKKLPYVIFADGHVEAEGAECRLILFGVRRRGLVVAEVQYLQYGSEASGRVRLIEGFDEYAASNNRVTIEHHLANSPLPELVEFIWKAAGFGVQPGIDWIGLFKYRKHLRRLNKTLGI